MAFGRLAVTYADGRQATITLDKPTVRIGRASDNDIVLNDALVDPYHAQLLCDARGCQVLDLSSGNGTTVNGLALPAQQPRQLGEGHVIRIGNARLVISLSGAAGRAPITGKLGPRAQDEDLLTSLLGAPLGGNGRARITPSLGTAQPSTSTAATQPMAPPVLAPTPPQLHLSLSVADLTVDAGGTVMLTATVVNSSKIVDRIEIIVDGLPAAWVKIVPPSHSLFPAAKGESQIVITPPRAPTSTARTYTVTIIAQSEQRPADRIAEPVELTILPYSEFRLDPLDPKEQTAWMQANYMLQISNRGNQDQSYEFQGANDQDAFLFRTLPAPFVVAPGGTARARLTARLRFLRWFGKPQTHQFTVSATPADASAATQQVAGRFIQNPPLPPWLLILLAVLLLLALLGCCGYFLGPRLYNYFFNRPTTTPTAVVTPTLPGAVATEVGSPVATLLPTIDVQATQGAQTTSQAATSVAMSDSLNQTATAVAGSNSATQAAFGESAGQTQTAQANNFGQTQTAGAINIAQTQTAMTIANDATSTAQANLNATATAAATIQQQTQTAQAAINATATVDQFNLNATATAEQFNQNATATANILTQTALPGANAATLTAVAQNFNQTQTAGALFLTQTAAARPTNTPTWTPTPTPTPTPIPEADEVFTFGPVGKPTNFDGTQFAPRNLIICTYDGDIYGDNPPPGLPNCFPTDANGNSDIRAFEHQTQPVIYPPSGTIPFAPTNVLGDDSNGAIMVLTFPQRAVSTVRVNVALANQSQTSRFLYRLRAYDGEGQLVKQVDSNLVTGPAIYQLSIGTTVGRIRQVQVIMLNNDDGLFFDRPLYVSRIAFNYSP